MRMKRTHVVLDEQLLEEAVQISGERTYARTITRALEELVRRAKARQIDRLAGSGLWSGDLGTMRRDNPVVSEKRAVYRARRRAPR
jgi:hypothetical protein